MLHLQKLAVLALAWAGWRVLATTPGGNPSDSETTQPRALFGANETLSIVRRYVSRYPWMDAAMVMAVVETESSFDPSAINASDPSYGLMQIMPTTAADMGYRGSPPGLLNPEINIKIGMKYLDWIRVYLQGQLRRGVSFSEIVGAYNAGVGRVVRGYLPARHVARFQANYQKWRRRL